VWNPILRFIKIFFCNSDMPSGRPNSPNYRPYGTLSYYLLGCVDGHVRITAKGYIIKTLEAWGGL